MKKILISLLFLLPACVGNHMSHAVAPESLVSTSDERISFPISDAESVKAIDKWVSSGDMPSTAEITCKDSNTACKNTKALLKKHKIHFTVKASDTANLALTYSHIAARNCDPAKFGCTTSLNTLNMLTDRKQIVSPALSDPQDAARAVKAINKTK